jgi:hypothetical protein
VNAEWRQAQVAIAQRIGQYPCQQRRRISFSTRCPLKLVIGLIRISSESSRSLARVS